MKNFTFHKIIVIIGVMISFIGGFVYLFNNNSGQNHTQETHAPLLVKMDASWPRLYQNLSDLKHASDVVVEGSITGIKQQTVDQKIPYSDFNFQINQVIIDPGKLINGNNIIIHQTGGPETLTINGKSTQIEMEISDDPLMQVGDHLILFLHQYAAGYYFIIGGPTGRFLIQNGFVHTTGAEGVSFISPSLPTTSNFATMIGNA